MRPLFLTLAATMLLWTAANAQNTPARPTAARPNTPANPSTTAPTPLPTTPAALGNALHAAERTQNSDSLLLGYGQAVTDSQMARAALSQLLADFYILRNQARTPEQATQAVQEASLRFQVFQAAQNQLIIQQNQRIIELLEKQAGERRTP